MRQAVRTLHYVYVLECSGGYLYTGYTMNPQARLKLHNSGKASKFTRSRLPVRIVYVERKSSKSKALKREHEIKKMTKQKKLKLLLSASKKKMMLEK